MIKQIEQLFESQVRPMLAQHGGNVELIDVDNDKVFIRLQGGCQGCSSSKATLKGGIEKIVQAAYPFIEEVVDLTDHQAGENPYLK